MSLIYEPSSEPLHISAKRLFLNRDSAVRLLTEPDRFSDGVIPCPISLFTNLISQKVFRESFCTSQFSHKFVDLSFIITNLENKSTDLCDFKNTFCEINSDVSTLEVGADKGPRREYLNDCFCACLDVTPLLASHATLSVYPSSIWNEM